MKSAIKEIMSDWGGRVFLFVCFVSFFMQQQRIRLSSDFSHGDVAVHSLFYFLKTRRSEIPRNSD